VAILPLGPLGVLVIQRTLNHNRKTGFYSALGIALSDTIYAALTGFGMALILGIIRQHELWFKLAGAIILIILGIVIFLSHPERQSAKKLKKTARPVQYLGGTFMVAISNPYIIFWQLAIFSGFGIALTVQKPIMAIFILLGFFTGELIWWFFVTWLMDRLRNRFSVKFLLWFNRLAGAGIVVFVMVFLIHTIYSEVTV
jgi:threonine/homoserine/homoserine lactone efflux protein